MLRCRLFFPAAIAAIAAAPLPATGQDYLGTHLDTIREAHMRQHQQDMASGPASGERSSQPRSRQASDTAKGAGCSADALPASVRRQHEAQYAGRLLKDGKASADAWAQEQGRRFREKLQAEGVC